MNFNLNSRPKNIFKLSLLVILYLAFFYFSIFKNILNFFELKEYITLNEIKKEKMKIENEELKKSLEIKKKSFEERLTYINNINICSNKKLIFSKISEALNTINMYMIKNKIDFVSLGRIQKNENIINVSLSFMANEENTVNFIKDIENSAFYFSLNDSYFKIELSEKNLLSKFYIKFKVAENFKKIYIIDNKNYSLFNHIENLKNSNSYMRIGNNIFYKKNGINNIKGGQKE
ncbi:MAG: hypothetical protein SOY60_00225 [Fusobacterium gastrosuis]|uniref:hypothetical protein n=1 Tax=Fusobacterium gastrosuis TaxID=1755100 RepID=UPI002A86E8FA|nr:hypothetical protein [Fusobacterium gastrosuis]